MKKFSFFALAAASLMLASCSNDEDLQGTVPDGTPVEVTFTTQLPADLATRAYGEGKQAKDLYYAVYTKGGEYLFKGTGSFPATELQTTVTIQLVTGAEYQVVFWAQNTAAPYTFNAEAKTMTIDYTTTPVANNNENLDAFYVNKSIKVNANQLDQEAVLKRPFAQINIATGDKAVVEGTKDAGGNYITKPLGTYPTQSQVTLSNVPNKLNLLDGTVEGDAEVTLALNAIPEGQITVGGVDYDYLSMSYVLAPTEGDVINTVQMNVNSYDDNFVYTNIPVKRNYKTNIVGDLLTTKTLWNVIINPIFEDEAINVVLENIVVDASGVYHISGSNQLAVLNKLIVANSSPSIWPLMEVQLDADLDMSGYVMEPLYLNYCNFNGNNHTISNLTMGADENGKSGFISYAGRTNVKNLTLKNVTVCGAQAGILAGQMEQASFENVKIAGKNTVVWSKNAGEEWNGVGAVAGVVVAEVGTNPYTDAKCDITIVNGATVDIYPNGMTTLITLYNNYAYYTQSTDHLTVTNNGTINRIESVNAIVNGAGLVGMKSVPGDYTLLDNVNLNINEFANVAFNSGSFVIDGNGNTINGAYRNDNYNIVGYLAGTSNLTVKNVNYVVNELPDVESWRKWAMNYLIVGSGEYVFEGVNFSGLQTAVYVSNAAAHVTFKNCKFNTQNIAVQIEVSNLNPNNYKFENCDFTGSVGVLHAWSYGNSNGVTLQDLKDLLSTCTYDTSNAEMVKFSEE